jgi:uncharacterized protein
MDFDQLTIALLILREDAPVLTAEEEAELQDAHMSYLTDLHEAGQLHAAGPLLDPASSYRGLMILPVGVPEALALSERDPAVRAGKFRVAAFPWMLPAGAMSFTPTSFPRSMAEAAGTS